jgi:nicotinamidase-related amidase
LKHTTALLVIDVQVGLLSSTYHTEQILTNITDLVMRARKAEVPLFFIQHDGDPGSRLAVKTPGWQIHPAIAPKIGETVLRKRASDAFYQTPLHEELYSRGITHLVISGCKTEMCIDTTSRIAISRGYEVTLVSDAHTTTDNEILSAAQIIAHHNYVLDDFGTDEHVIVTRLAAEVAFTPSL